MLCVTQVAEVSGTMTAGVTTAQGGLVLALSALVEYHSGLGPFNECSLDFGYSFPGAPPAPAQLVAECGATSVAAGGNATAAPGIVLPGNATGPGTKQ